MKVISEKWGNDSYDHIVICFHSVILEGLFFGSLSLFKLAFKRPQQTTLILYQQSLFWPGIYFKTLKRSQLLVVVIYCLSMYYQTPFSDSCIALDYDLANGCVFKFISINIIFAYAQLSVVQSGTRTF